MVVGYHLIWTAYGWWLPNDPRGSSSHEIRVERIEKLGTLHHGRKLIQPLSSELREFYRRAGDVLRHELLTFDDNSIQVIADSIGKVICERKYTCYACAIMPDHVHLLIRRHRDKSEQMIEHCQNKSRDEIVKFSHRPIGHPVWGGPGWKVFLNTRADMERVVRYVFNNPIKARRPAQNWNFVRQYDGWMPQPAFA